MKTHAIPHIARSLALRTGDENLARQWRAPAAWFFTDHGVDMEEEPLIDADTPDGGVKPRKRGKKGRRKLSSFVPFLKGKPERGAQNPFGDEHAIDANTGGGGERGTTAAQDEQMEIDTHDGPVADVPTTPSSTEGIFFPVLAAALTRTASAPTPTLPMRSPSGRTPGSVKSRLSEVSKSSSRKRKGARRSRRLSGSAGHDAQMRSMKKTVQVLGPEAAGAVVKGTDVSPNKLRCMDLEREMKTKLKRSV